MLWFRKLTTALLIARKIRSNEALQEYMQQRSKSYRHLRQLEKECSKKRLRELAEERKNWKWFLLVKSAHPNAAIYRKALLDMDAYAAQWAPDVVSRLVSESRESVEKDERLTPREREFFADEITRIGKRARVAAARFNQIVMT
jgi:hypothetical protein